MIFSIVKIKGNEYNVLASLGEEHLGGEDFNKRIIDFVMEEIKKDKRFKNINFNNKNDKMIIKSLNKIRKKAEKVKIELSKFNDSTSSINEEIFLHHFLLKIYMEKVSLVFK